MWGGLRQVGGVRRYGEGKEHPYAFSSGDVPLKMQKSQKLFPLNRAEGKRESDPIIMVLRPSWNQGRLQRLLSKDAGAIRKTLPQTASRGGRQNFDQRPFSKRKGQKADLGPLVD